MQPDQSSNASMHKRDLRVEEEIKPLDDMDSKGAVAADGEVHLRKSFSLWSILGVGFGLTNSWFGISTSMVAGISSGGPMMIVYGIIIVALISICIGTSLGELSSAYPHAGGQFWWSLKHL